MSKRAGYNWTTSEPFVANDIRRSEAGSAGKDDMNVTICNICCSDTGKTYDKYANTETPLSDTCYFCWGPKIIVTETIPIPLDILDPDVAARMLAYRQRAKSNKVGAMRP